MSNRGQNLPFTPFRPLAWFLIGSFAFVLSFRALSFPLFTSLKRCWPFCKLFARNFHFKRLYCLIRYFVYLGGYLLTTGQIYGFFAALPTVCSLSHINGKTPAFVSGADCLIAYAYFVPTIWATKMRLGSTGVGVFRSPFYHLQRQTYRGGLSIYRKFRVKISTRSAYLFGASIIRGAFGRHIRNYIRAIIFCFHAFALW